jgi:serine/threonine-protein kinase
MDARSSQGSSLRPPSFWQRALEAVRGPGPAPAQEPVFFESSQAPAQLAPGMVFAGFRVERIIARGSGTALYGAIDTRNDAAVALKIIPLVGEYEGAALDAARERFLHEAKAAAALRHPDIVEIFGGGESQGCGFIVMELLSGTDLTRYTRPARLLPEPIVLRIVARVADALAYAHSAGLVHRDVKPANVVVDLVNDQVKLTDFGIARITDGARSRSGLLVGTPLFMAPEQLAGSAVDGRADLYALGVMLFQLLTGRLPYEAPSMGQLLAQIAHGEPQRLQALRPGLPDALDALIAELLQKQSIDRPGDGHAVAAVLRDIDNAWSDGEPPIHGTIQAHSEDPGSSN